MLFVTFLLSGIILFLIIYAYSVMQLKRQNEEVGIKSISSRPSSTESKARATDKRSIFERFKRKPLVSDDFDVASTDIRAGGVTAKIAAPAKEASDVQVPDMQDSHHDSSQGDVADVGLTETFSEVSSSHAISAKRQRRIAPKFSFKNKFLKRRKSSSTEKIEPSIVEPSINANKAVLSQENNAQEASKDISNVSDNFIKTKKIEPELAEETINKGGNVVNNSSGASHSIVPDVVPIEQLAEEYAAQQAEKRDVNPDEIDQAITFESKANPNEKNSIDVNKDVASNNDQTHLQEDMLDNAANADVKSDLESGYIANQDSQQINKPIRKEFKASADAVEIVAKIHGGESVSRDDALVIFRRYDYLFTRHLGIYGKNHLTEIWEDVEQAGQEERYSELAVSLQLADKTGAMTRKESNTFSALNVEIADQLNMRVDLSMDIDESVEKGRMLDELARKYDAMVVCNIIPKRRKGFRSTDIKSCTKDLHMTPANNGVFGRYTKIGRRNSLRYSLALANNEGEYISATMRDPFQVDEIVVFLNVPLVANPSEAFDLMIQDARKLRAWLDGKIVDKNARNMTSRTLDKIAEQIAEIEKEMSLDGLIPGSDVCKKLF